jgi:hypothetical protein
MNYNKKKKLTENSIFIVRYLHKIFYISMILRHKTFRTGMLICAIEHNNNNKTSKQ